MRSLRGRLAATYFLVVFLALAAVDALVLGAIETFTLRQRDVAAFTSANVAANLVEPYFRSGAPPAEERTGPVTTLIRSYAAQSGVRLLVLDKSGAVLADSQWPVGYAGRVLSHPEAKQALAGRSASGRRYLEGSGWVHYTVVPVLEAKTPVGAVFLSSSLSDVYAGLRSVAGTMLTMSIMALLVATLAGLGVALTITGPLGNLTRAVERMGKGDLKQRVEVRGRDEVAVLSKAFNDMAARLSREDEERREFLADVAHELQTPVSAIRAMAEPLAAGKPAGAFGGRALDGRSREEQPPGSESGGDYDIALYREMAKDMEAQSERLGRLVGDLLELARLDSPRVSLVREEVDLGALVAGVIRSLEVAAKNAGVFLEAGPLEPATVIADGMRLEEVFLNLIDNGLKHAGAGSVVRVSVKTREASAVVTVADNGRGLEAADLERIWERFYRVDRSRSRQRGGTGLGLAIVRRIVELHGGSVSARSVPGQGTEFAVTLPLA